MIVLTRMPALLALASGCSIGLDQLGDTGATDRPSFQGWGEDGNDGNDQSPDGNDSESDGDSPSADDSDSEGSDPPPGGEPDDSNADDEPDGPAVDSDSIVSISPQHGSTLGGTRVSVRGGPFPAGTEIDIGGVTVPVSSNVGDELRFETPPFSDEGWTTVTAVHPDGSRHGWSEGFHFWTDGTGLAGAAGYYQWIQPVGGYWVDGVPPAPWGGALVAYVVPEDFYWWNLVTSTLNTCTPTDAAGYDGDLFLYDFGETNLRLQNGYGSTTLLTFNADSNAFENDTLLSSNFIESHSYTAQPFTGSDAPPDAMSNFIETPASFGVSYPGIESLYAPPDITRSQTVVWDAGGADVVWIEMARINALGTAVEEGIICIVSDTGSFTVPASAWTSWPIGQQVNLFVSKARISSTVLPHNNSESRVSGMYTVFGAGRSW